MEAPGQASRPDAREVVYLQDVLA
eukprot:COSAG01_NODE_28370_length_662_cov_2.735346_2_plen_23_part_01